MSNPFKAVLNSYQEREECRSSSQLPASLFEVDRMGNPFRLISLSMYICLCALFKIGGRSIFEDPFFMIDQGHLE